MVSAIQTVKDIAVERLNHCCGRAEVDWSLVRKPRFERANFATRYHFIYPAIGHFIRLKKKPELASSLRPQLDLMYRALLEPRTWRYWHDELNETSWPLKERNLTYAGRLATFIGFYIDAFGSPPAGRIELDGQITTYTELSESLYHQMTASPTCGVSCYHHQSMVMCNAHMLINNTLHDRLFGTDYATANEDWLSTVDKHLITGTSTGPLFYFGTKSDDPHPILDKSSLGADIWSFFAMSGVEPGRVRDWFTRWRGNISEKDGLSWIEISPEDHKSEFSSNQLASSWAFCLARELGDYDLADKLAAWLRPQVEKGFDADPFLSGLYVLGEELTAGAFHKLVTGEGKCQ